MPQHQHLTNFMNSVSIPSKTYISEDSKVISINKRQDVKFVFLGLGYLTQDDYFQLYPFTYKYPNLDFRF